MTTASVSGPDAHGRHVDWPAVLKESLAAGGIAFLLTIVMVGLRATDAAGGLVIQTRFEEVAVSVILVFIGRLGIALTRQGMPLPVLIGGIVVAVIGYLLDMPSEVLTVITVGGGLILSLRAAWSMWRNRGAMLDREERERKMDRLGARVQRATIWLGPAAVAFAIVLPFLPFSDRTTIDTGTVILTYIMLGWGLNIIVGLAGLLDLGYVAFYAIGAYSFALLATTFDLSFWACLPLAGAFAALGGLILGFPVLRLRGDYFAIVTLGFGEIIRIILLNWYEFTGGPNGILGIPEPSFFGLATFTRRPDEGEVAFHQLFGLEYSSVQEMIFLYYLILGMALIVNFFTMRIRRLPIGRSWEALREDDIACQSLGINRRNIKLAAFAMSAMFGGFAGSFFATRQGFISPESFSFIESAIILAIVVLGGMGSQVGVALGAVLLIGLPEIFRELEQYRMLAFGAAMVLIMIWRPRGLLAHREPTIRLEDPRIKKRTLTGTRTHEGAPAQ